MKKYIIIMLMIASGVSVRAQLTLEECKQMAHDNYPTVKQLDLLNKSYDLNLSNASKAYLPQVSASAMAAAFTDIIDASATPAMPLDMKNELYMANITVKQSIYDGGATAAKKRLLNDEHTMQTFQHEVNMYEVNSRVEEIFFGILAIDEQIAQTKLLRHDLELSMKTVQAMIKGGVANTGDAEAIEVEQIKAEQQEQSLHTSRATYTTMLGIFIGKKLDKTTALTKPTASLADIATISNHRTELSVFAAKNNLLNQQRKALNTYLMPKISAFGMGAYHNKMMAMMKNSLFAVGLNVSWNIGALYTRKNDIRNIEVQQATVDSEREAFLFNTQLQSQNTNGSIVNLTNLIEKDRRIIELRESIRNKSEKKVSNGIETVNEMLRDINAVSKARQDKAIHEIQLLSEIYKLKHINNN